MNIHYEHLHVMIIIESVGTIHTGTNVHVVIHCVYRLFADLRRTADTCEKARRLLAS